MSKLINLYLRTLEKHPWKVQAVSAGVLMASGDAISQIAVEKKPIWEFDASRTSRYLIFGMVSVGPVLRLWYMTLERLIGPSVGLRSVVSKVALDQGLFAPAFLAYFIGAMTFWETKSVDRSIHKVKKDYKDVMVANWKFTITVLAWTFAKSLHIVTVILYLPIWPAAQMVNFYFIPFQHRVIFVQVLCLFWNTYLAFKVAQETSPQLQS